MCFAFWRLFEPICLLDSRLCAFLSGLSIFVRKSGFSTARLLESWENFVIPTSIPMDARGSMNLKMSFIVLHATTAYHFPTCLHTVTCFILTGCLCSLILMLPILDSQSWLLSILNPDWL